MTNKDIVTAFRERDFVNRKGAGKILGSPGGGALTRLLRRSNLYILRNGSGHSYYFKPQIEELRDMRAKAAKEKAARRQRRAIEEKLPRQQEFTELQSIPPELQREITELVGTLIASWGARV